MIKLGFLVLEGMWDSFKPKAPIEFCQSVVLFF